MSLMPLFRFLQTIRQIPPGKLVHRLRLMVLKKLLPPYLYTRNPSPALCPRYPWGEEASLAACAARFPEAWPSQEEALSDLCQHHTGWLLNQRFALPHSVPALEAMLTLQTLLWRENYNYLTHLLPLAWAGRETPEPALLALLEEQLRLFWGTAKSHQYWSTYGVSRRILSLCEMLPLLPHFSEDFRRTFCRHLYQDALYTSHFLAWDLDNNHLIKDFHALLAASIALGTEPQARRWEKQLQHHQAMVFQRQTLADGGNFERTPTYHTWVLADLLDCLLMLKHHPRVDSRPLTALAQRMMDTLTQMLHASGQIPMFSDSSLRQAFPASLLQAFFLRLEGASPQPAFGDLPGETVLPQTGLVIFRQSDPPASLVVDCGDFAPREMPGHAHCDLASIELHVGNRPIIVDSGINEYHPDARRHYFRSTGAHNTLWVPGEEQAQVWGSFRVSASPHSQPFTWKSQADQSDALVMQYENHNHHYRHTRQITPVPGRFWWITDTVDFLQGDRLGAYSLLHLHPHCEVRAEAEGFVVDEALWILPWGATEPPQLIQESPWHGNLNLYSEGFNLEQPGQMLALPAPATTPCGWVLIPLAQAPGPTHRTATQLTFTLPNALTYRLDWATGTPKMQKIALTPIPE